MISIPGALPFNEIAPQTPLVRPAPIQPIQTMMTVVIASVGTINESQPRRQRRLTGTQVIDIEEKWLFLICKIFITPRCVVSYYALSVSTFLCTLTWRYVPRGTIKTGLRFRRFMDREMGLDTSTLLWDIEWELEKPRWSIPPCCKAPFAGKTENHIASVSFRYIPGSISRMSAVKF